MKTIIKLLFLILVIAGASHYFLTRITYSDNRPHISNVYCQLFSYSSGLDKPIIFIPGIKGSILEENGKTVWLTQSQTLRETSSFTYDPNKKITSPATLDRLVYIPWVYEYRSYYEITSQLACTNNFYTFGYDWRKVPQDNAADLQKFVERVEHETNQKPSIIAHSMGGLITRYMMNSYADHVDKIVYVGTPFQPGLSFLGDYQEGSTTGLNKKIQDPEALFSAPALLALLPHSSQLNFEKENLMDIKTWQKHQIGLFKDNKVDEIFFSNNLQKIKEFEEVIDRQQPLSDKHLFVIGNCQDTWFSQLDEEKKYAPGDSRVVASGARPSEYLNTNSTQNVLYNCAPHDQQLNTPEVVKHIVQFLR